MVQSYASLGHIDAVLEALDKAADKIRERMPDPDEWGSLPSQRESAAKAEAMFGPA